MLVALVLSLVAQAPPSPDAPGPHTVAVASNVMVTTGGRTVEADVYTPDRAGAPYPIVIIGHGFARTNDNVAGHAQHLASWGMVVVAPNFPSRFAPDHAVNGAIMRDLLAWARGGPAPIGNIVDPRRSAYVGHSAGGLAAFLATAGDPTVTALVGLDPVDAANAGANAAASITVPTLVLAAVGSRCNANASADAIYAALAAPDRWRLRVVGATHCDAEDPSNTLCTSTCGGEDAARRTLFRRYLTAQLRAVFACEASAWLPGGAMLMADVAANRVGELDAPGTYGCAPGTDAGIAPASDATAPAGDATAPADDAAGPADDATAPVRDDATAPAGDDAAGPAADATAPVGDDAGAPAPDDATTSSPDAASPADAGPPGTLQQQDPSSCACTTADPAGPGLLLFCALAWSMRRRARS